GFLRWRNARAVTPSALERARPKRPLTGVVYLLASQHALDADGGHILHLVLSAGALPGIHSNPAAQSPIAQTAVIPGLRAPTAQACAGAGRRGLAAGGCRHELVGRVISRTCDNAFDCRRCRNYSHFAVLPARA